MRRRWEAGSASLFDFAIFISSTEWDSYREKLDLLSLCIIMVSLFVISFSKYDWVSLSFLQKGIILYL